MADSAGLDAVRLRAELFFIHEALSGANERTNLLADLEAEPGSASARIWRSLYSDCLRAVRSIANAGGNIHDLERGWMRELLLAAASRYAGMQRSPRGQLPGREQSSREFFESYFRDDGPFGYGSTIHWRGLELCRRAEAAGDRESLPRYSRLMRWLIDEACKASGVSQDDPGWRRRLPDIDELLQTLTAAGQGPQPEVERRIRVFVEGSHVFAPIEKTVAIYTADPFDVESIHDHAHDSFRRLVKQAATESAPISSGRTLLVVGAAGYGKTHLMRSFWSYVQEYGRGFVAYAQMDASVDDYARYFLHQLVESLKSPYSGRAGGRTALEELADGLVQLKGADFATRVERLAELTGHPRSALDHQVNQLVDELLGHPELAGADPDLVRVLLYALCGDPKTRPRVYQYLCCDEMTDHDRSLIGRVVPRTAREDRAAMIRKLAHLAFATRRAPLVLMLDQVERSGDAEQAMVTFQRAVDALLGLESQVGSAVVVIGCLSNLYDKALKVLGRSTLDRLVKDPPPARLRDQLSYDEIQAIVGRRLAWMFAEKGAVYRASEPVYPIPEAQLRKRIGHRLRDILEWCQQFQERCVAAKRIIEVDDADADAQVSGVSLPPIPPIPQRPPSLPASPHPQQLQGSQQMAPTPKATEPRQPQLPQPPPPPPIDRIASAWNDTLEGSRLKPLDDDDVLALVAAAAHAYAEETGVSLTLAHQDSFLRLKHISGDLQADLVIGVTNRGPQAGAFGTQIKKLRQAARGAIAIAVRTDDFPSGAKSVGAVEDLRDAGGRAICLDKQTLRTLLAHQSFQPAFSAEHIQAWRHSKRPIASLQSIAEIFGLNSLGAEAPPRDWPSGTAPPASSAAAG